MAIKITCNECSKRISIDEAFAGGVCRCPYCTTINDVPLHPGQEPAPAVSKTPKRVPVAKKASLQGLAAIAIFAVLLGVIVSVIVTIVVVTGENPSETPTPVGEREGSQNPFKPLGPGRPSFVAGTIKIESPVVYCLDGDASMASYFRYASRITRVSVDSLSEGDSAQVFLIGRLPTESIVISGGEGSGALDAALADFTPGDGEDIDSVIERAIETGPKTVVIITRREPEWLWGDVAAREGVRLITVGIAPAPAAADRLRELAADGGGESRIFSALNLAHYAKQVD